MNVISSILIDSKCQGIVIVVDGDHQSENAANSEELFEKISSQQKQPITFLDTSEWKQEMIWTKDELVCMNVAIFGDKLETLLSMYRQITNQFIVNKAVVITECKPHEVNHLLLQTKNEKLYVLQQTKLFTWKANNSIINTTTKSNADVNVELESNKNKLSGRHLMVGTLPYPPSVVIDNWGEIRGIEASLLEVLADRLNFTYDYVQASPKEMWGDIIYNEEGNITFTGLIGMLARKEVDAALGQLYISSTRWPFIGYTSAYKFSYESFLVPAPRPYSKWKALFYSFTLSTWIATIGSSILVIFMLRLVGTLSTTQSHPEHQVFSDLSFCWLYIIGNLSNVQMQPQNILSAPYRMSLIWWLFGTLILTTGYRSRLISYMTFPFTPPAIDTLQQLIDSPLKKLIFGSFLKSVLVNSSAYDLEKRLGEELIPNYNLTEMYLLLGSGPWAVQSNVDNLLYMAASLYPSTTAGPQVHLIKDAILPVRAAFGLQKYSQLKPYFDREINRIVEFGLVDYHTMTFAKKLDVWNPKKSNSRISFSLDSLQGAFYLLLIGSTISVLVFLGEFIIDRLGVQKKRLFLSADLKSRGAN